MNSPITEYLQNRNLTLKSDSYWLFVVPVLITMGIGVPSVMIRLFFVVMMPERQQVKMSFLIMTMMTAMGMVAMSSKIR